jgi:competence protein ComEA
MSRVRQAGLMLALLWSWQGLQAQEPQVPSTPPAVESRLVESRLQVNINEADAETIADVLTGIGPVKAQAIVKYREEHGPFQSVNDLTKVSGIGAATLRNNLDRIRIE